MVHFTQRVDLILFRGDLRAFHADVVGDEIPNCTSSGLWPSDHGGVVATFGVHVPQRFDANEELPRIDNYRDEYRGHFVVALMHKTDARLGKNHGVVDFIVKLGLHGPNHWLAIQET
jgi:hypothetical protein